MTAVRRRLLACFALALLFVAPACNSPRRWHGGTAPPTILKQERSDDGTWVEYRLVSGQSEPKVNWTEKRTMAKAYLGIETKSLNAELATSLGLTPWRGVYIDRVVAGSAAESAGLLKGDVLRFLGATEVTAREQVSEIIRNEMAPGEEVIVKVQRWATGAGDGELRLVEHEVLVTPGARDVEETRTRSFDCRTSSGVRRRTGMRLAELTPGLSATLYDSPSQVVLVSWVTSGSPAYRAGVRKGDRILTVDGEPVRSLQDVRRAVVTRAAKRGFELQSGELDGVGGWLEAPAPEGRLEVTLDGALGPHVARFRIEEDLDEDFEFYFPILLDIESDTPRTKWSFLDFILQFGANYESRYVPSTTRKTQKATTFSMLPFGMFEYSGSPDWTEWTFLWFIKITS